MYPKRSSRQAETSKESPQETRTEEVIKRRVSQRRKTWLKEAEADKSINNRKDGTGQDHITLINSTWDGEEEETKTVEMVDKDLDESDEDSDSTCSSIASGPSFLYYSSSKKKKKPSQSLCLACQKLYQKAQRLKRPIKSKLLDNDPKSLTCDQWVLLKTWKPRRLPNKRGNLLRCIQLVNKAQTKRREANTEERASPSCSRLHIFLQRNLRWCTEASAKKEKGKKNKRKRTRVDSPGSHAAKQQCLHSNRLYDHSSSSSVDEEPNSRGRSGCPSPRKEMAGLLHSNLTAESVNLHTTKPNFAPFKWKTPPKNPGFRDLLIQLRGSNSMIVKETHK
ncbi:uncharacterized protein KZ484_020531 isoform 1-T3 [Pholidichthys leucotaenia]